MGRLNFFSPECGLVVGHVREGKRVALAGRCDCAVDAKGKWKFSSTGLPNWERLTIGDIQKTCYVILQTPVPMHLVIQSLF